MGAEGDDSQIPMDATDQHFYQQAAAQTAIGQSGLPFAAAPVIGAAGAAGMAETLQRASAKADLAKALDAGATMLVDPDKVDGLARFFEDEAKGLRKRQRDVNDLASIDPPGTDPVSTQVAAKYGEVAAGDDSAYLDNYLKLADRFDEVAANLRAHATQTRTDEQNAVEGFRGVNRA
ncbi:hypothetical protein [Saccharopolyspora rosea]|uniref:hypothetical protein n=1 Tax=Saccharopolyspora rosea TaxID=524884 RepID=UPI0021DAA8FB|nr:hypothetical protein [Saccharopolyspora rosea]